MERFTLYTNYLTDSDKDRLQEELNNGKLVCVSSNCIGHTRAAMVQAQGERYLESIGCVAVEENALHEKFYKKGDHHEKE